MQRLRKIGLALYLLSALVVVGACAGSLFGPYQDRFAAMLATASGHVVMALSLAIVVAHLVVVLIRMLAYRPEPKSLRLRANPDIEVTTEALEALARTAARDRDIMIERVTARIASKDMSVAEVCIEAISLAPRELERTAQDMQQRVQVALDEMLGVSCARVRVRFLPSKTTTVTKEVASGSHAHE